MKTEKPDDNKRSPAPWKRRIVSYDGGEKEYWIVDADGGSVCEVRGWDNDDGNSLLVSTAPDLLKALKSAEATLSAMNLPMLRMEIKKARAAIAKAEGWKLS